MRKGIVRRTLLCYCITMKPQEVPRSSGGILRFATLIVAAVAVYFGVLMYRQLQNTPENTVQRFVQNLQAGEVDAAYRRLGTELKNGREQYWKDYLAQFKTAEGEAALQSQEFVKDTFSTYPTDAEPQRFVYKFRLQGRDYHLSIVTYKLQNVWVIGGLNGGYK